MRRKFNKLPLATAAAIGLAAPAQGFGLHTHIWIAQQIYDDLLPDCHLTIRGVDFEVPADRCEAIKRHRLEFLSGSVGPDAFPDLIVGQSIVHPGVENGWQANQWIAHLLTNARSDEEKAFAWGYAMHFAGDTFAHSYVNNYAGDVFELFSGGSTNVELRHFRLEKYMEQHLPYRFTERLRVPSTFLARQLIQFDYVDMEPLGDGYFEALRQDPLAYIERAGRRLRSHGPAMHLTTMRTALELARAAEAYAPRQQAEAEAEEEAALGRLNAAEREAGLPPSNGIPYDRRSDLWEQLPRQQRENIRARQNAYQAAVDEARLAAALVVFTREWAADVEGAMAHYIEASVEFAENMLRQSGEARPYRDHVSMTLPYSRWLTCYTNVLRGRPLAAGEAVCERLQRMGVDINLSDAALRAGLGRRVRLFYFRLLQLSRHISDLMTRAALQLGSLVFPSTSRLLRELIDPARVDHGALNWAFRRTPNGQVHFECVADWIDADLGLRPPLRSGANLPCDGAPRTRTMMDPHAFAPLEYALVLGKLSLLDETGVRDVASRFGGSASEIRFSSYRPYSLLLDTVRSIDGNQQWQSWSMPFPRKDPYGGTINHRSAGYPDPRGRHAGFGFPFYQTEGLREGPFRRLFPRPYEGSILMRREMRPPDYPFVPCPGDLLRGEPAKGGEVVCPPGQ